jgi:flagellar hook-associated protein FlgK
MTMDLGSVVNQALIGLQNSQMSMVKSAQQIAQAGVVQQQTSTAGNLTQDLIEPLINLKIQRNLFDASARVVQTADETLGTLLDIKA